MSILPSVEKKWPKIVALAEKYRMANLKLFGSVSRGEDGPESDIDFMAEPIAGSKCSLLDVANLKTDLGKIFDRKVDVCTQGTFYWFNPNVKGSSWEEKELRRTSFYLVELVERLDRIKRYTEGNNVELFLSNPIIQDAVICNLNIIFALARSLPEDIYSRFIWYDRQEPVRQQDAIIMWNTYLLLTEPLKAAILNYFSADSVEDIKTGKVPLVPPEDF